MTKKASSVSWFESGEAEANAHEMLFFALLLISHAETFAALDEWAKKVLQEKTRAEEATVQWKAPRCNP